MNIDNEELLDNILQNLSYQQHELGTKGLIPLSKNEAEAKAQILKSFTPNTEVDRLVREAVKRIRYKVGWEEEPDFDPGDATYGDSIHDHNAVIYGRNEVKGSVQGIIENELAELNKDLKDNNGR